VKDTSQLIQIIYQQVHCNQLALILYYTVQKSGIKEKFLNYESSSGQITDSVVEWSEFLVTYTEVPDSIPSTTRFSE
jgi:hypothetical protein